jgi:hypothetical protein
VQSHAASRTCRTEEVGWLMDITSQARANRQYVRTLLRDKQPQFAAVLTAVLELVELESAYAVRWPPELDRHPGRRDPHDPLPPRRRTAAWLLSCPASCRAMAAAPTTPANTS